ncbi:MAG: hypothetical protein R3F62_09955 [Planctomycetota bacterium]
MKLRWFLSLGALLVGLSFVAPAVGQDAAPARYTLAGRLAGKVLYANGLEARVEVELQASDRPGRFTGSYTLTPITEDASTPRRGEVRATVEGDTVRAAFDGLQASGTLGAADPHAVFALYGSFAQPGGVFMLYRYRR